MFLKSINTRYEENINIHIPKLEKHVGVNSSICTAVHSCRTLKINVYYIMIISYNNTNNFKCSIDSNDLEIKIFNI